MPVLMLFGMRVLKRRERSRHRWNEIRKRAVNTSNHIRYYGASHLIVSRVSSNDLGGKSQQVAISVNHWNGPQVKCDFDVVSMLY